MYFCALKRTSSSEPPGISLSIAVVFNVVVNRSGGDLGPIPALVAAATVRL